MRSEEINNNKKMHSYYLLYLNAKENKFNEYINNYIIDGKNLSYLQFKNLKSTYLQAMDNTSRYYIDIPINTNMITKGLKRINFIYNNITKYWICEY